MTVANHEITYHNLDTSPALNEDIKKRLDKLERYSNDIQHIRIVVDSPHNHQHKGKLFRIAVEISLNGSRNPIHISQDDPSIHAAVKHAFESTERQLKSHSERCSSAKKGQTT